MQAEIRYLTSDLNPIAVNPVDEEDSVYSSDRVHSSLLTNLYIQQTASETLRTNRSVQEDPVTVKISKKDLRDLEEMGWEVITATMDDLSIEDGWVTLDCSPDLTEEERKQLKEAGIPEDFIDFGIKSAWRKDLNPSRGPIQLSEEQIIKLTSAGMSEEVIKTTCRLGGELGFESISDLVKWMNTDKKELNPINNANNNSWFSLPIKSARYLGETTVWIIQGYAKVKSLCNNGAELVAFLSNLYYALLFLKWALPFLLLI